MSRPDRETKSLDRVLEDADVTSIEEQLAADSEQQFLLLASDPQRRRGAMLRTGGVGALIGAIAGSGLAFAGSSMGLGAISWAGIPIGIALGAFIGTRFTDRALRGLARQEADRAFLEARGFRFVETLPLQGEVDLLRHPAYNRNIIRMLDRSGSVGGIQIGSGGVTISGGDVDGLGGRIIGARSIDDTYLEVGSGYTGKIGTLPFRVGTIEHVNLHETTDSEGRRSVHENRTTYRLALIPGDLGELRSIDIAVGKSDGWIAKLSGALSSRRPVNLESMELSKTYGIFIDDNASDLALRERFTPHVQQVLIDRGAHKQEVIQADSSHVCVAIRDSGDFNAAHVLALLAEAIWWRELLCARPAGRVPDEERIRRAVLATRTPPR